MTFSLHQILSDPQLKCPKGQITVQINLKELASFTLIIELARRLRAVNIDHDYHGNGTFTIYNS
jgi:hypothetical protein